GAHRDAPAEGFDEAPREEEAEPAPPGFRGEAGSERLPQIVFAEPGALIADPDLEPPGARDGLHGDLPGPVHGFGSVPREVDERLAQQGAIRPDRRHGLRDARPPSDPRIADRHLLD